MRILTLDDRSHSMDQIPDEVDETLRFCVFDNSNPKDPDYFFIPLIFLESFSCPALVLRIGSELIRMPVDWQVLIGEPDVGDLEVVPLSSINDRGFSAFTFNPLSSFSPVFEKIEVVDIFQEVRWFFPKLKPGQMLAVPLQEGVNSPRCAYFVKDISRASEIVDYRNAW